MAVGSVGSRRRLWRAFFFTLGLALVWITVAAIDGWTDFDLTIALLIVLAEVLAVATLAGPVLGIVTAMVSVVFVNWYLVPPFHTFEIANPENVTALVVFTLVAAAAAFLVEFGARARTQAEVSQRQAQFLADIVAPERGDRPRGAALRSVREALVLDHVALVRQGVHGPVVLQQVGESPSPDEEPVVDVMVDGGYQVMGYGPQRMAADPAFLAALADAAVRSYQSDRMVDERQRAEELAAIDRARTALLAGVGHDLRTPLSGLRVAVDALSAPGASLSDENRDELLETISGSVDRLDELITNLLDLSRLEAGALITRPVPADVGEVVLRAVLTSTDPDRVVLDIDDAIPDVVVDPMLLERVVANLVSNSLRHTPAGTGVVVAVKAHDTSVVISVTDHGPGIPESELQSVMAPFRQLPGAADAGSGLGLAVVAGFSAAMGLELNFSDTVGGGLTARVAAPLPGRDHVGVRQ